MSDLIVIVREGKLKGAELESSLGSRYIAFRGIPFAAPPIGELRFKVRQQFFFLTIISFFLIIIN